MSASQKNTVQSYFFPALLGNLAIGGIALILSNALGGPQIYIDSSTAVYVFSILLAFYLALTGWSISSLLKNKAAQNLTISGPGRFVRHPIYSAIIFLLNPALAILLRSWLLILAVAPIYFIWKIAAKKQEKSLEEKFGRDYLQYQDSTWPLFPNLWRINKPLSYALTGLAIFGLTFLSLNFSAAYLRWTTFEKHAEISFNNNPQPTISPRDFQRLFTGEITETLPNQENNVINFNSAPDSIIISKLNINAPLVAPSGTTQKELNSALNQGVIVYPGSALPGQNGEVFLSGHSSIYPWVKTRYGQIFTLLDKLETGDTVSLIYSHRQYDYRIIGKEILTPDKVQISSTSEPKLTLMTCWPIGTSLKRLIIKGELIK